MCVCVCECEYVSACLRRPSRLGGGRLCRAHSPLPHLPSLAPPSPSCSLAQPLSLSPASAPSPLSLRTPTEMHSAWGRGQPAGAGGAREGARRGEGTRGGETGEGRGEGAEASGSCPAQPRTLPPLPALSPFHSRRRSPHSPSLTQPLTHPPIHPSSTSTTPFASLVLQRDGAPSSSSFFFFSPFALAGPKQTYRSAWSGPGQTTTMSMFVESRQHPRECPRRQIMILLQVLLQKPCYDFSFL